MTASDAPSDERRRLSFGASAAQYDRYRPSYPSEALVWAVGPTPCQVVDLGAGTGLMTRRLLSLGHEVTAVEPDEGMLAQLRTTVPAEVPTLLASAERLPLPDASQDAVVVGQAFHWFDPEKALPEIARVLRPGGHLGLVWNIRDDDHAWVAEVSRLVGRLDARSGTRDATLPDLTSTFVDVQQARFYWEQELGVDDLVGLVSTFSYVALSPQRDEILDGVRRVALEHPDLAGRERFAMPYDTVVYRARRPATTG